MNGKTGPLSGSDTATGTPRGTASGDVWLTLGQTASMSPDERARRGLTPPDAQPDGPSDDPVIAPLLGPAIAAAQASGAAASGREALASNGAAPGSAADAAAHAAALPVDDSSRYELEGVHARGGLGRVVRAHDRLLQRTVAIK